MKLKLQKKLAALVMKGSKKRVVFDISELEEISGAITKADVRRLIKWKVIKEIPKRGVSRARANYIKKQKAKGLRKGHGKRKGPKTARTPKKRTWINHIRSQRKFLKDLYKKGKLLSKDYRMLYKRAKSGFFRNKRHIKLYIKERNLLQHQK